MTITTRFTRLLDIEHPVVQGGMQWVGRAELAAAVSEAGGLGILTGLTQPTPEALRDEIERCRSMTSKPFGVNLTVFPTRRSPDYLAYARAIVDGGVDIVETAGTSAVAEIWELLRQHPVRIVHKCTAVRHAVSAARRGVDAISIDGFECAGHPGEDDIPGLVLIPCAVDQISIPMVASGGFADGRGLAAALALGADGINMGTRFVATRESPVHPNVKQALVDGNERSTNVIFRSLHNTARVAKNPVSDEIVRRLALPGATFEDVAELAAGERGREVLENGDLTAGMYWASMAQGLINDIPTVAELVERIVRDAEMIISQRLSALISPAGALT